MVWLKPGPAGWKSQTNALSYCDTPDLFVEQLFPTICYDKLTHLLQLCKFIFLDFPQKWPSRSAHNFPFRATLTNREVGISVTRWLNCFKYLAIYNNENLLNSLTFFCQNRLKKLQNTFNNSENSLRLFKFCQNGDISPNLVTLVGV